VTEGGRMPVVPVMMYTRARSAAPDVPLSAGELEIVATVDVTFAIR